MEQAKPMVYLYKTVTQYFWLFFIPTWACKNTKKEGLLKYSLALFLVPVSLTFVSSKNPILPPSSKSLAL